MPCDVSVGNSHLKGQVVVAAKWWLSAHCPKIAKVSEQRSVRLLEQRNVASSLSRCITFGLCHRWTFEELTLRCVILKQEAAQVHHL